MTVAEKDGGSCRGIGKLCVMVWRVCVLYDYVGCIADGAGEADGVDDRSRTAW